MLARAQACALSAPLGAGLGGRPKATSLLLTLFGDALASHRSAPIALSTLIGLSAALGVSARHVRTSVQRLAQADWLLAHRSGRCSFYHVSGVGLRRMLHGDARIFATGVQEVEAHPRWNFVVLGAQLRASARLSLGKELMWCGFGEIAPGVFAQRATSGAVDLHALLAAHQALTQVWTLLNVEQGTGPVADDSAVLRAHGTCGLRLQRGWQRFTQRIEPWLDTATCQVGEQALAMRTLLVHEYRRILLNHPELPFTTAVDGGRARREAQQIFARLYLLLLPSSEEYLDQMLPGLEATGHAIRARRVAAMRAVQEQGCSVS